MAVRYSSLLPPLISVTLAGCAGFESTPIKPADRSLSQQAGDGIYYYMPQAKIGVQVVIDANQPPAFSPVVVDLTPDRSRPYLLAIPDNLIGKNDAKIAVTQAGLLSTSSTTQTSGASDLVKALATDFGTISALAGGVPAPVPSPIAPPTPGQGTAKSTNLPDVCPVPGRYQWLSDPEKATAPTSDTSMTICGFKISVEKLGGASPLADTGRASNYGAQHSGVFYKIQIPYLITLKQGESIAQAIIAYSPNESPIQFAPLKRSMFADNTTSFTVANGVLTGLNSNAGGELTGLATLPTTAISAYMTAVGQLFTAFKTNSDHENDAARARAKLAYCKSVLASSPISGVSPTQIATNIAAIKNACGT